MVTSAGFDHPDSVTAATIGTVSDVVLNESGVSARQRWLVLVVKVPANPSRHRVAVWRQLRRSGAVPLGQGIWTLPDHPGGIDEVERIRQLITQGQGDLLVLTTSGQAAEDADSLLTVFSRARDEEWSEFLTECGHYVKQIATGIAEHNFTLAELEEEEQSLQRLQRWHRDVMRRDVFGSRCQVEAGTRLQECIDRLEEYAQLVHIWVEGEGILSS